VDTCTVLFESQKKVTLAITKQVDLLADATSFVFLRFLSGLFLFCRHSRRFLGLFVALSFFTHDFCPCFELTQRAEIETLLSNSDGDALCAAVLDTSRFPLGFEIGVADLIQLYVSSMTIVKSDLITSPRRLRWRTALSELRSNARPRYGPCPAFAPDNEGV